MSKELIYKLIEIVEDEFYVTSNTPYFANEATGQLLRESTPPVKTDKGSYKYYIIRRKHRDGEEEYLVRLTFNSQNFGWGVTKHVISNIEGPELFDSLVQLDSGFYKWYSEYRLGLIENDHPEAYFSITYE